MFGFKKLKNGLRTKLNAKKGDGFVLGRWLQNFSGFTLLFKISENLLNCKPFKAPSNSQRSILK